jgi:hypothetical protein
VGGLIFGRISCNRSFETIMRHGAWVIQARPMLTKWSERAKVPRGSLARHRQAHGWMAFTESGNEDLAAWDAARSGEVSNKVVYRKTACPSILVKLQSFNDQPLNAGITSRANQRNCSSNSVGDRPSAQ